jgi:hypothetical protein
MSKLLSGSTAPGHYISENGLDQVRPCCLKVPAGNREWPLVITKGRHCHRRQRVIAFEDRCRITIIDNPAYLYSFYTQAQPALGLVH